MIDYPENFKGYPRSVSDARSDKTGQSKDWNPRDVLLDALRDIDSGVITPDALMVVYRNRKPDGTTGTGFLSASPDGYTTCALFEYGKRVFFNPGPAMVALMAGAYGCINAANGAATALVAML